MLWVDGDKSSNFLPVKISMATMWTLAWPCLPSLGSRHFDDLAWPVLDDDVAVLPQGGALHGEGGRGASVGALKGNIMLPWPSR